VTKKVEKYHRKFCRASQCQFSNDIQGQPEAPASTGKVGNPVSLLHYYQQLSVLRRMHVAAYDPNRARPYFASTHICLRLYRIVMINPLLVPCGSLDLLVGRKKHNRNPPDAVARFSLNWLRLLLKLCLVASDGFMQSWTWSRRIFKLIHRRLCRASRR